MIIVYENLNAFLFSLPRNQESGKLKEVAGLLENFSHWQCKTSKFWWIYECRI